MQSLLVSSIHTLCVAVSLGLFCTYTVCYRSLLYIGQADARAQMGGAN